MFLRRRPLLSVRVATLTMASAVVAGSLLGCAPDPAKNGPSPESDGANGSSSPSSAPSPPPAVTTATTATGLDLTWGDLTVTAESDVADEGTEVTAAPAEVGNLLDGKLSPAVPPVELTMAGDSQPQSPVTLTWQLPAGADSEDLAFITRPTGSDQWQGIPVVVDGTKATVKLDHFSTGYLTNTKYAYRGAWDAMDRFFGQSYAAPACFGKPLKVGKLTYKAETASKLLYPCVELANGKPRVAIYSNSPFVWRVTSDGVKAEAPEHSATSDAISTELLYRISTGGSDGQQTMLYPGGIAPFSIGDDFTGTTIKARVDAGLGLMPVLGQGISTLVATGAGGTPAALGDAWKSAGDCVAQNDDISDDKAEQAGVVVDCLQAVPELKGALPLAIAKSQLPALVTNIRGVGAELSGEGSATIQVSVTGNEMPVAGTPAIDALQATAAMPPDPARGRRIGVDQYQLNRDQKVLDIAFAYTGTMAGEKVEGGYCQMTAQLTGPQQSVLFRSDQCTVGIPSVFASSDRVVTIRKPGKYTVKVADKVSGKSDTHSFTVIPHGQ